MKAFPEMAANTWEVWTLLHLSSLSAVNSTGDDGKGTKGPESSLDFTFGLEKYFSSINHWLGRLSLSPFMHFYRHKYTSIQGHTIENNLMGYGLAADYHFLAHPLAINRLIWWIQGGGGLGKVSDSVALKVDTASTTAINAPVNLSGKANFYFLGTGIKYNFHPNFSLRMMVDYYVRGESYPISPVNGVAQDPYTKKISGFRFLVGPAIKVF